MSEFQMFQEYKDVSDKLTTYLNEDISVNDVIEFYISMVKRDDVAVKAIERRFSHEILLISVVENFPHDIPIIYNRRNFRGIYLPKIYFDRMVVVDKFLLIAHLLREKSFPFHKKVLQEFFLTNVEECLPHRDIIIKVAGYQINDTIFEALLKSNVEDYPHMIDIMCLTGPVKRCRRLNLIRLGIEKFEALGERNVVEELRKALAEVGYTHINRIERRNTMDANLHKIKSDLKIFQFSTALFGIGIFVLGCERFYNNRLRVDQVWV